MRWRRPDLYGELLGQTCPKHIAYLSGDRRFAVVALWSARAGLQTLSIIRDEGRDVSDRSHNKDKCCMQRAVGLAYTTKLI